MKSRLEHITLTQFRNFHFQKIDFSSPVVGITGLNGIGKTNLLDAIYYLCFTKSYFQSKDKLNALHDTNGFRISGSFVNEEHTNTVTCVWKEGKKTIENNAKAYEKSSEHIGKYSAVMIAPDDSVIITGGSEYRRKFFDGILCLSDAQYLAHLMLYQKILQQKNAYLKMQYNKAIDHNLLDLYDMQLSNSGAYLITKRRALDTHFPAIVSRFYHEMSGSREIAGIQYENTIAPEQLQTQLYHSRPREIDYKRTLVGPHTEDWTFTIKDSNCKSHASQGQKKSFLISLKLAQLELLKQQNIQPILLLDDILEKLDAERLQHFFKLINSFDLPQIFFTHTNAQDVKPLIGDAFDNIQIVQL